MHVDKSMDSEPRYTASTCTIDESTPDNSRNPSDTLSSDRHWPYYSSTASVVERLSERLASEGVKQHPDERTYEGNIEKRDNCCAVLCGADTTLTLSSRQTDHPITGKLLAVLAVLEGARVERVFSRTHISG